MEKRWTDYIREYEDIAKDLGLDPKDTVFEEEDSRRIYRYASQLIPIAPQYWDRGRWYLKHLEEHERGSRIYEIVFNMYPARAYIGKDYSEGIKAMTAAHVLGHSHVFKVSKHEEEHRYLETLLVSYIERVKEYEKSFGVRAVERAIDLAYALNPTSYNRRTKRTIERVEVDTSTKRDAFLEATTGISKWEIVSQVMKSGSLSQEIKRKMESSGIDPKAVEDEIKIEISSGVYMSPTEREAMEKRAKKEAELNGEEDLIHYFTNTVKIFPDWVRDILRVEGEIYRATRRPVPITIIHEGLATWAHEAIISRSSSPGEWKVEAALSTASIAVPFFIRPTSRKNEDEELLSYSISINPYGFGVLAMRYLESKGKEPPEVVRTATDYHLINELLDDDFYFEMLRKSTRGTRSKTRKIKNLGIPAEGDDDNFYKILSDTYKEIEDGSIETVDEDVISEYSLGDVSAYYVFLYELAKYMIYNEIEDPSVGVRRMLSYSYAGSLPRISAHVNPRTNKHLSLALEREGYREGYTVLYVKAGGAVEEMSASKRPSPQGSVYLVSDSP